MYRKSVAVQMYLTVGQVSQVEDEENIVFQQAIVMMPGDKEVVLGKQHREPLDPTKPSSPLYITLHNVTPGTNADLTVEFVSGGG